MYIVFLTFSENRDRASQLMQEHKDWIQRGFEDGVFLLAGSLQPKHGGALLAHNTSLDELQSRINEDPFVAERVVQATIHAVNPSKADERLQFLLG